MNNNRPETRRVFIEAWGVGGVAAMLMVGVGRLLSHARQALEMELLVHHWVGLVLIVLGMAWVEGYRGFHLSFAPRVVARALWIARSGQWLPILLAPLVCMGLCYATRRRLVLSWGLTAMIVGFVVMVRWLAHPWRGFVDAGVVVGLSMGSASMLWWWRRVHRGWSLPVAADVK